MARTYRDHLERVALAPNEAIAAARRTPWACRWAAGIGTRVSFNKPATAVVCGSGIFAGRRHTAHGVAPFQSSTHRGRSRDILPSMLTGPTAVGFNPLPIEDGPGTWYTVTSHYRRTLFQSSTHRGRSRDRIHPFVSRVVAACFNPLPIEDGPGTACDASLRIRFSCFNPLPIEDGPGTVLVAIAGGVAVAFQSSTHRGRSRDLRRKSKQPVAEISFQSSTHRGRSRDLAVVLFTLAAPLKFQSSTHRGRSRDGVVSAALHKCGPYVSILYPSRTVPGPIGTERTAPQVI
jgi:hypothetical protein